MYCWLDRIKNEQLKHFENVKKNGYRPIIFNINSITVFKDCCDELIFQTTGKMSLLSEQRKRSREKIKLQNKDCKLGHRAYHQDHYIVYHIAKTVLKTHHERLG